jgi:hypothetical protein
MRDPTRHRRVTRPSTHAKRVPVVVVATLACLATSAVSTAVLGGPALAVPGRAADAEARGNRLAAELRRAVNAQHYQDVLDTTPVSPPSAGSAGAATPIHQMPNVDVAVIELDSRGRPVAAADVLLSPRYPDGVTVPLNGNLSTDQVRWRWWNTNEWDVNNGQGTRDVLPGRDAAPIDFMSPYPASVLKLMVGFGVLRLADKGAVSLDDEYAYQPVTQRPACGGPTTKTVRQFFDEMITVSKNESACALIKLIHDLDGMDELNSTFTDLGLGTLRLTGTNPDNGGVWTGSNMSAIDTAKLLLIVNGGSGTLWIAPDGTPVTRDVLSDTGRAFFVKTLGDQGHNEMLSTTNWCGRPYPAPGIPQVTPHRWIDPQDGTMNVAGASYGQDVRPCNDTAEVTFAHKTGWVSNTGSDAGIVHSLPGKVRRDYIVAVFSNLGTDYVDARRPADPPGIWPVLYTEKHAKLGVAIDCVMKSF